MCAVTLFEVTNLAETSNRVAVVFDRNLSACLNNPSSGAACVGPGSGVSPAVQRPPRVPAWDGDSLGDVLRRCAGRAVLLSVLQGLAAADGQALSAG